MNVNNEVKLYALGRFIEPVSCRLGSLKDCQICGININHGFIPTVANMLGVDTSKYKIVPQYCFACNLMHIGRDKALPLAYNRENKLIAVSPAYYIFRIKEQYKDFISSEYLEMILTRTEFERLAWFNTDGSIRGNLPEQSLYDIKIPLPSFEKQKELVATYNGLRNLAEQNEAIIPPLAKVCEACIINCKGKYHNISIGNMINIYHEKNTDCKITLEQGINIEKQFISPQRSNSNLSSRIIVRKGQFAYCTQLNNENVAIALREDEDCVVSPVYNSFEIKKERNKDILPKYLFLWLKRKEFGRYVYWKSIGSAYEFLQEENLCEYTIPLPPLSVQQSIVNIYNCLEEAKSIATNARENLKGLCSALIQKGIKS